MAAKPSGAIEGVITKTCDLVLGFDSAAFYFLLLCRGEESNLHRVLSLQVFETCASAIPPPRLKNQVNSCILAQNTLKYAYDTSNRA
jgi:hypothetical protein